MLVIIIVDNLCEMKERKNWSAEEDKVLKYLIEERKMTKWSQISEVMEKEF